MNEHHELLDALASLVAVALQRLRYAEAASAAHIEMRGERLRSSILSALSHDLRTPLTALVGLADSLAIGAAALPLAQRETAEAVRDQALRLSRLVSNLLDMARLNAGEVRLRKAWQPLEEVVGSSLKLLEAVLDSRPLRVRLAPDLPLLELDATLIERVLCNLIENAAKYSPPGAPIDLTADTNGAFVEVAVRDRGPGVAAGQSARIFEMFTRAAPETAVPGVGLGLAIARAIVEAHGGSIGVGNAPDGGSRFSFTLPRGTPPAIEVEELTTGAAAC